MLLFLKLRQCFHYENFCFLNPCDLVGVSKARRWRFGRLMGKRCLLINDWVGLNSDEEPVFEFLSNIYKSKPKQIKRCKFVYGLNLTLNYEIAIKLCFKSLNILMLKHVERIEVAVDFHVSSFPLPFLHLQPFHLLIPTEKPLHNRQMQGWVWWWQSELGFSGLLWENSQRSSGPLKWVCVFCGAGCLHRIACSEIQGEAERRGGQQGWWSVICKVRERFLGFLFSK